MGFTFVIVGALAQTPVIVPRDPGAAEPAAYVEVTYARPGLFAGQHYSVSIFWKGFTFDRGELELLRDGSVVRTSSFPPPALLLYAPSHGVTYARMSVGATVDPDLEPGTYRVRARWGDRISKVSEPFTIEPWGMAVDGVQIGLAPSRDAYVAGGPVAITVNVRNVSDRPICAPLPMQDEEFARLSWEFWPARGAALFDARPLPSPERRASRFEMLRPGEVWTAQIDLHRLRMSRSDTTPFGDRPGQYVVGAAMFMYDSETPCAGAWRGRVNANFIRVDVK